MTDLCHVQLHVLLGAALDLLPDLLDDSLHVHDGLLGHVAGELDHLPADLLADEDEALHRHLLLPDHHEALLALGSAGVQPPADVDRLLVESNPEVADVCDHGVGLGLGLVHLLDPVLAGGHVWAVILLLASRVLAGLGFVSSFLVGLLRLLCVFLLLIL